MPWQECSTMSLREEFVMLASQEGANISQLCGRYQISRKTGYKWLGRHQHDGVAGLADRSRRPQHSPAQTSAAVEAQVLALRDAHPAWGGRKLRARLLALGTGAPVPSASTITAILARHGRLDPAETAKHTAWQRFEHAAPNDLWQMDFKGPITVGTTPWHPLLVLDDHSRFALGIVACPDQQMPTVQAQLTTIFRRYGLPWQLLADHGPPWGAPQTPAPLTTLGAWLIRLGITLRHGRVYHPQTQGKVERFGRTVAAEVLAGPAFADPPSCHAAFTAWREVYNLERPHAALDLHPPASRYRPSPRPLPDPLPRIAYEPDDTVRMVHGGGQISYRGRRYFVSQAVRGQPVALRPTTVDGQLAVYYCHQQITMLDLRDPEAV